MTLNLDILAALLSGWLAMALFALHAISSPKRHNWMTLPEYVRKGLWCTGATFMVRSVNFVTLAPDTGIIEPGHVNAEGMVALIAITYTATALTFWAARRYLPAPLWMRMQWLERAEREHPERIPVPLTPAQIEEVARSEGIYVNTARRPLENEHPPQDAPESLH